LEVNSFSKAFGFTNLRCSFTVIPDELKAGGVSVRNLWARRQSAKFNGVSYIIQRGAEAALSQAGQQQCRKQIAYYKENAKLLSDFLKSTGAVFYGGENAPYIWLKCPDGENSWGFFDRMLNETQVVVTAGAGFGKNGENFVRLSVFAKREDILEAIARMKKVLKPAL
jgi:LL-diaminopimelate aminotransferase